jgi:hypothetical protein
LTEFVFRQHASFQYHDASVGQIFIEPNAQFGAADADDTGGGPDGDLRVRPVIAQPDLAGIEHVNRFNRTAGALTAVLSNMTRGDSITRKIVFRCKRTSDSSANITAALPFNARAQAVASLQVGGLFDGLPGFLAGMSQPDIAAGINQLTDRGHHAARQVFHAL